MFRNTLWILPANQRNNMTRLQHLTSHCENMSAWHHTNISAQQHESCQRIISTPLGTENRGDLLVITYFFGAGINLTYPPGPCSTLFGGWGGLDIAHAASKIQGRHRRLFHCVSVKASKLHSGWTFDGFYVVLPFCNLFNYQPLALYCRISAQIKITW